MFQIMIVPDGSKANAVLFFLSKETCDIAQKNIHEAQKGTLPSQVLTVKDDFGCTVSIDKEKICYAVILDGDKQAELASQLGKNRPTGEFINGK